ncbi:MAG: cardiolipin synthase [Firmicutes bacterium HGW-Firmicutes-12]|jgi:cardiolipin synthase|nr:MAG: cardiolipin synthase [Firmicutes bacterium HGW-Firmicutes-12]
MKKSGASIVLLFILLLLIINALIINTAYKAIFTFFREIAPTPYFQITTDILSVLLASLVVFTSVVIILERRDPARTLAWLLILIFIPVLGFILYLTVGRHFRKRRLTAKKRKMNGYFYPQEGSFSEVISKHEIIHKSKERLMQLIMNNSSFPVTLYNDLKVLSDGEQIFSAMVEAMESAKKLIHLETYILRSDNIGTRIIEILLRKAAEGVDVRVIYDGLGSRNLGEGYLQSLRDAGVNIRPFFPVRFSFLHNRINYRNHRKILVVDNEIGFLGGVNIGDEYLGLDPQIGNWRDTHLRINGNAVCYLDHIFLQDWFFVMREPSQDEFPCPLENRPGNKLVQIAASGPDTHWESIMQIYYYAIATAEKSIFLTSPYFIPNESILTAFKTAALSGVDVKLLLPANPDHKILFWAAMSYLEELLEAGVEIYLYQKGFIHAKVLTIDGIFSSVGSANMDQRSFKLNFEVNALLYDEETTKRLETDFWNDLQYCEQIILENFKERPLTRRVLESATRLLSPLL